MGAHEADLLMDRPLGGWGDLVTKDYLDARFDMSERVMNARFEAMDAKFGAFGSTRSSGSSTSDSRGSERS